MRLKPAIRFLSVTMFLVLLFTSASFAQLAPMNENGVTMGHVHLLVPDVEAHKKLWVDLFGAQVTHAGQLEILKIPGIIVLIIKGDASKASGDPVVDHFALVVKDLDATKKRLAAANIRMPEGSAIAEFPDGVRAEFIEDKGLGVPVAFHHFHIYTSDIEAIRSWYTKTFGGIKFPAGPNFPGGEMKFTQTDKPRVPTKGHAIDHISFEVKDLPEFCKKVEAQGTKLDMAIVEAKQIGLRVTFVTDPIGTRIEITEGLADK
jgi:predicted enzyme related to lactoylglutathione lyase